MITTRSWTRNWAMHVAETAGLVGEWRWMDETDGSTVQPCWWSSVTLSFAGLSANAHAHDLSIYLIPVDDEARVWAALVVQRGGFDV